MNKTGREIQVALLQELNIAITTAYLNKWWGEGWWWGRLHSSPVLSPEPIKPSEIKLSTVSSVSSSKPLLRLRGLPAWWVDLHGSFWVTLVLHQSDEADGLCRSQRGQSILSTYILSHSPLHDFSLFVSTLSQGHYQRLYIFSVIIITISSRSPGDLVLYAQISRKILKHM